MKRIKNYLPTVLISVVMPLIFIIIPSYIMFVSGMLRLYKVPIVKELLYPLLMTFEYRFINRPVYQAVLCFILCTAAWLMFYMIVIRKQKVDFSKANWKEEYAKGGSRVKISIFTQMIVILAGHIIPFVIVPILFSERKYPFFISHGDGGEFIIPTELVVLVSMAFFLLEPLINFLWCMLLNLILVRFPAFVCRRIKSKKGIEQPA